MPYLGQNTPNPSKQNTEIKYYLPENMVGASITIKTIDGKTLQNYPLINHGTGQITINGGTLAPGTYIYEMITNGNLIDSKKMVIIGQ